MSYLAHHRLDRHGAVHQPNAGVGGVAVDTGVGEGGVFVAAELQDGVVHLGAVEDSHTQQQVEVVDGEAGDPFKERRLQFADDAGLG